MDFNDTAEEASFRSEVRDWISSNAPTHLAEPLASSTFGGINTGDEDPLDGKK